MDKKIFVDTNVLLNNLDYLSSTPFIISNQTLIELEDIKTNKIKTEEDRFRARKAIRFLRDYENYEVYNVHINKINDVINYYGMINNPDSIICASARLYCDENPELIFLTNDISCHNIAKNILGLNVEWPEINNGKLEYTGFKEIVMDDESMAYFYEHQNENRYDLLINQYLIIKNTGGEIVDTYRWNGEEFVTVKLENIKSTIFGPVKPYHGDIYQKCLLNSFSVNKITMVSGPAGSGKTWNAIGYLLYLLEKHRIDKIIVFTNTVPTLNSAKLGFYPGTRDDKLCESSIGNILASKLGDSFLVDRMISEGKLLLIPMCDIRGYDTTSTISSGVLITEAQNMDVYLMKLALQRIGENSICIIDGDYNTQVDSDKYSGDNNGMRRLSEVFRGQDFYGEVQLQNIYRSRIAEIAERM